MTRQRVPIISTIVVLAAAATMIALGVWQLHRLQWKEGLLATYRASAELPATAWPAADPYDDALLFRTLTADCARVESWQVTGGASRSGTVGWRHIAHCASGPGKADLLVDVGIGRDPAVTAAWDGGVVSGRATQEPDRYSFITRLLGHAPPLRLMIVADQPAPGLEPSAPPDIASVPNNHLSYAIQWFAFALIALVIYVLALKKRWREEVAAGGASD